ncbi:MAG TPA: hypothetical protein VEA78_10395 [Acidimicrobiales bacterium]|nr:hypothetical protein [Acidimicrobiales bacterium]
MVRWRVVAVALLSTVAVGCSDDGRELAEPDVVPIAPTDDEPTGEPARWEYDGTAWVATGTPTECELALESPVDTSAVTSVLYPGQIRGGDYKSHGGFRFDDAPTNDITVTSPMPGEIVRLARYLEQGEVQHLIDIVNPCGLLVRFDHLRTVAPPWQPLFDALPEPQPDDSRTTPAPDGVAVATGDPIATAVGFTGNVSFDYGVYDLRSPNNSAAPPGELSSYGVCWLTNDAFVGLLELPPGDPEAGTTSDYCI